jgi:hypothetical protein
MIGLVPAGFWWRSYQVADGVVSVTADAATLSALGSLRGNVTYNRFWANRFQLPAGWHVQHVDAAWAAGETGPYEQYVGRPTVVTVPHVYLAGVPWAGAAGLLVVPWLRSDRRRNEEIEQGALARGPE